MGTTYNVTECDDFYSFLSIIYLWINKRGKFSLSIMDYLWVYIWRAITEQWSWQAAGGGGPGHFPRPIETTIETAFESTSWHPLIQRTPFESRDILWIKEHTLNHGPLESRTLSESKDVPKKSRYSPESINTTWIKEHPMNQGTHSESRDLPESRDTLNHPFNQGTPPQSTNTLWIKEHPVKQGTLLNQGTPLEWRNTLNHVKMYLNYFSRRPL